MVKGKNEEKKNNGERGQNAWFTADREEEDRMLYTSNGTAFAAAHYQHHNE
jgi:hypothetical protein